jgi:hypothetical protein
MVLTATGTFYMYVLLIVVCPFVLFLLAIVFTMTYRRRTDDTMTYRIRTDDTMTYRIRTDDTMTYKIRTDEQIVMYKPTIEQHEMH